MSEFVSFGDSMRRRRRALDLTQQQLAERAGCATTTIVKFENETRRPSREMAERLAEVLEVPAAERATFLQVARRKERGAPQREVEAPNAGRIQSHPARTRSGLSLPTPSLPLIGRDGEIAVLKDLFTRPQCRLVTIVGPGGIGKTRLAIQLAAELAAQFADGAAFVALAPLASADALPAAIAEATGLAFQDAGEPRKQMVDYLRPRRMILVLDCIEHLLSEEATADLVATLLEQAPELSILVTSRERLNLQREWIFEVQGLSMPPLPASGTDYVSLALIEAYPSVALFLQHARRLNPGFQPTPAECAAIARICRSVEGLPLGIELSAAWAPALSCAEIAAEIERGIDFLSVSARDMAERHRSIRAVFDHSWRLLSADEQRVLRRLAVFRGSFTRRAAETVAGANLGLLSALVAKSLVRRMGEKRYDLHELIAQYSAGQLQAAGEELFISQAHAEYFLGLAGSYLPRLQSADQRNALADLNLDIDNLRGAWNWAVAHALVHPLQQAAWALWYFVDMRNMYREEASLFLRAEQALQALQTSRGAGDPMLEVTLGQIRTWRAFAGFRLGQVDEGRRLLGDSLSVFRRHGAQAELADALWVYGLLGWLSGEFDDAAQALRESLALNQSLARPWQVAFVPVVLGAVRHDQGAYSEAYALLRQGLDLCLALGVPRNIAFALGLLARTVRVLGYHDDLQGLMSEHLRLATEMEDHSTFAFVLENLALAIQAGDDPEAARQYFGQAIDHYVELGDLWSASRTLSYAGQFELAQGAVAEAQRCFHRSFETAMGAQSDANAMDALVGLAEVKCQQNADELALQLALTVFGHPASSQPAKDRAERLRAELTGRLSPQQATAVAAQAQYVTVGEAVKTALRA